MISMLCKPDFAATALPTPKESFDLSSLWFEGLSVLTMLCRTWTNRLVNYCLIGRILVAFCFPASPCFSHVVNEQLVYVGFPQRTSVTGSHGHERHEGMHVRRMCKALRGM